MKALAEGTWLDRERVMRIAVITAALGGTMLVLLLVTSRGSLDAMQRPLGTDFSVFWNAGRLANSGQAQLAWNPDVLNAAAQAEHGSAAIQPSAWLYPPVFLLAAAALALLPYVAALLLWQALSIGIMIPVLAAILRDRRAVFVALASPMTPSVLGHGQNAYLTAALIGGGLVWLDRKPGAAGTLFGGLVYKPQLGLLLAPFLLLGRCWMTLAWAFGSAAMLIGLSLLMWGVGPWHSFVESLPLARSYMEQGAAGFFKSGSIFASARLWGLGVPAAYTLQAAGAGAALLLIWRLRDAPLRVRAAGLCAAAALSTPYLLDYDLAVVGIGAAFLYADGDERGFLSWERTALAAIWAQPLFARPFAEWLLLPSGPLISLLLAGLALRRYRRLSSIAT